jgi:hypothetical protein
MTDQQETAHQGRAITVTPRFQRVTRRPPETRQERLTREKRDSLVLGVGVALPHNPLAGTAAGSVWGDAKSCRRESGSIEPAIGRDNRTSSRGHSVANVHEWRSSARLGQVLTSSTLLGQSKQTKSTEPHAPLSGL